MKKAATEYDARFREQIEAQMARLLQQVSDLEEFRDDLEPEEYDETLADTKQQLVEFGEALDKIREGDVTLLDALSRMKMAVQAAISDAFKTPEVVAMFMQKEPGQLRGRLQQLDQQLKLRKISPELYQDRRIEVLTALQRLGEPLAPEEEHQLQEHTNRAMKNFAQANNEIGQSTRAGLASLAASQNTSAQQAK